MVQSDGGDDGAFRLPDDVGGIQRAAYPCLQDHIVHALLRVVEECRRVHYLELGEFQLRELCRRVRRCVQQPGEIFGAYLVQSVRVRHGNTLAYAADVGGGESSHGEACRRQCGGAEFRGGAFPVRPDDVDIPQAVLGVPEFVHEDRKPGQILHRRAEVRILPQELFYFLAAVQCRPHSS